MSGKQAAAPPRIEKMAPADDKSSLIRIAPYHYIHVFDSQTNVTRLVIGPQTFIRQDNEQVVVTPTRMVTVPPNHYCVVQNPVQRDEDGEVVVESSGQAKLRFADLEVRLAGDPFPLYPGEEVVKPLTKLAIVAANVALRLRAVLDFQDAKGVVRVAGDEWLFEGPGTYIPHVNEEVVERVLATVIRPNQALKLRARKDCTGRDGQAHVTGDEWTVETIGAYLPAAYEEVVETLDAYILTERTALHMRAKKTFVDKFGKTRKSGEEWLITLADTESFIPTVHEEVVKNVDITTLSNRQYCVIVDPVLNGKNQLGTRKVVAGEKSFFLQPGERLEDGIQDIYVLSEEEGLVLRAVKQFKDGSSTRQPGDRWMIKGPGEYIPSVDVEVLDRRQSIPLEENEGIYVRDIRTGKVRAETGKAYMLNEYEELWQKQLPDAVEQLLASDRDALADRSQRPSQAGAPRGRDKTRVVTYRVPHNAAVQVYDYKKKKSRVVFGPDLVMLGPDEEFTQVSLSGGKPKKPNQIRTIVLLLGPDFCTDIIQIETADHTRMQLHIAYNWRFDVDRDSPEEALKLFAVPDFIGDLCKTAASAIRGAVAATTFDDFHRNSVHIIRMAVFGPKKDSDVVEPNDCLRFPANHLSITSIDIQSAEPVDQRTRDALQKSVQLAIEITTNATEAEARHHALQKEQRARGDLDKARIRDEVEAERLRKDLELLKADTTAVQIAGQAKAEAEAQAAVKSIEAEAAVKMAQLKAEADNIEARSELERLDAARRAELDFIMRQNELEVAKAKELQAIEVEKFDRMVQAIGGGDTLRSIALAGPEMQVKLLSALGLKSTLITDGKSPINLFNTAQGLIEYGGNTSH
eukprot:comp22047_c0_seq1/m.32042 comp22047_c0_seq1/g.32042  ORF comp22047_c0_seq1/g.32042 comp22047_c0_seq1/m.32042 type:complete len:861 (-) comp22047_c0_seq1:298-2880(-)